MLAFGAAFLLALSAQSETHFEKKILPILVRHCFKCHQAPYTQNGKTLKPKSGLRLDGRGWILQGGKDDKVLTPGNPAASPMYGLAALPPDHEDRMPNKGNPVSRAELVILKDWIQKGADFGSWYGAHGGVEVKGSPLGKPAPLKKAPRVVMLERLARRLTPLKQRTIDEVAKASGGFITPINPGSPLLRVEFLSRELETGDRQIEALEPLARHITHISLARTHITDAALKTIASFRNLTRLDLRQTKVTDSGMMRLTKLGEIRSLNLFGTGISDSGLRALRSSRHLEAVYLRDTKVTQAGVERLQKSHPDAKVVHAFVAPKIRRQPNDDRRR